MRPEVWASCLVYSHAEAGLELNKERIEGVDLKRIFMRFILMMGLVSLFGTWPMREPEVRQGRTWPLLEQVQA